MRILGRKFYAYKSKNRRKNTPDSAFPRTLQVTVNHNLSSPEYAYREVTGLSFL